MATNSVQRKICELKDGRKARGGRRPLPGRILDRPVKLLVPKKKWYERGIIFQKGLSKMFACCKMKLCMEN